MKVNQGHIFGLKFHFWKLSSDTYLSIYLSFTTLCATLQVDIVDFSAGNNTTFVETKNPSDFCLCSEGYGFIYMSFSRMGYLIKIGIRGFL